MTYHRIRFCQEAPVFCTLFVFSTCVLALLPTSHILSSPYPFSIIELANSKIAKNSKFISFT